MGLVLFLRGFFLVNSDVNRGVLHKGYHEILSNQERSYDHGGSQVILDDPERYLWQSGTIFDDIRCSVPGTVSVLDKYLLSYAIHTQVSNVSVSHQLRT